MNDAQTTEKRLRILLADRSSEVLGLISNILEPGFEIVAAVHDSQSLLAMDGTTEHDLLVADILLPGINGVEQWKDIHRRNTSRKVLFLSTCTERSYISAAFKAGASGYILKTSALSELVNAIRAVVDGKPYVSPDLITLVRERSRKPIDIG